MSFKFGDMVRNDWAGDINPHKVGMFIYYTTRKSGPFSKTRFAVFAKDGDKWEHDASDEKLVVTGNVFDDLSGLREEIAMLRDKIKEMEKQKMELLDSIAGWAKQAARDVTARHTPGRYKATDRKMVQLDELLGQLKWMKSK